MPSVLEAENAINTSHLDDPDFGEVKFVAPWAWRIEDFMEVVRQRKNHNTGSVDTVTFVAQVMRPGKGESGQDVEVPWVCGSFALEKQDDGFLVAFLTVHPGVAVQEVVRSVLRDIKGRADRSPARKKVVYFLRDQTGGCFPEFVLALKAEGFKMRLVRDHFHPQDGWECVWESKT